MGTNGSSLYIPLTLASLREREITFPDHASYSFFSRLWVCDLQWAFKYLLKLPEEKTGQQLLGLTVHDVIDRVTRGIVPLSKQDITDDFHDGFVNLRVWKENDGRTDIMTHDDVKWGTARSPEAATNQANFLYKRGIELLNLFYSGYHQKYPPLMMGYTDCDHEEPLSEFQLETSLEPYGGKVLKSLVGRIDLIDASYRIIDVKTKGYKPLRQADFKKELQPIIYAFMTQEMGLLEPPITFRYAQLIYDQNGVKFDGSVGGKIPGWKIDVFRQRVLPGLVKKAEAMIEQVEATFQSEKLEYFMNNLRPGNHCDNCDWMGICPYFTPPDDEELDDESVVYG